jgi:predicted O-methyltransferase YrrM
MFEEVWAVVSAIPSFVIQDECRLLWEHTRPGDTVGDIGVGRGRTALLATLAGASVVAVSTWGDPTEGTEADFQANWALAPDRFFDVRAMDSVAAARHSKRETLDLVFVDGGHSAEQVQADIKAWAPKLKPGGLMAFHDAVSVNHPGVREALDAVMKWPLVASARSLEIYRKPEAT